MSLRLKGFWLTAVRWPLLLATLLRVAGATAYGAVKLDNMTFDKVVSMPSTSLLVKFDRAYASGEKEDAFKELCKLAAPVKGFLIGEVVVQEYGDKENEDLQNKFEVKSDEFPAYFLLKGSTESKVKFKGLPDPRSVKPADWDDDEDGEWEPPFLSEPSSENLALWLRTNGIKVPAIGTIPELNEIAQSFMKEVHKDSLLEEAKKVAEEQYPNDRKAPVYVKIMEKVKAKGVDYVQKEITRVKKIMDGKITPQKAEELDEKVKILTVFAEN